MKHPQMRAWRALLTGTQALLASLVLCLHVQAQTIHDDNYLDFELWLGNTDAGSYTLDSDAYILTFSRALTEGFSVIAGYRHSDFEEPTFIDSNPTQDAWNFGVGYRHSVLPRLDAFGNLRWLSLDSSFDGSDTSNTGLLGELGLAAAVSDSFGLYTTLRFVDVEDPIAQTSRELSITGQARWALTDRLSLAFGGELGEDEHAWLGSLRYALGGTQ